MRCKYTTKIYSNKLFANKSLVLINIFVKKGIYACEIHFFHIKIQKTTFFIIRLTVLYIFYQVMYNKCCINFSYADILSDVSFGYKNRMFGTGKTIENPKRKKSFRKLYHIEKVFYLCSVILSFNE